MRKRDEKVLKNRAQLENAENHLCDHCDNMIIFKMKDNLHEFSIGITTILNCLSIAEKSGAVPKLPRDWWISIKNKYNVFRG